MSSRDRETMVWDLPTRIFHWMLVVLVGVDLFLISPRGGLHTLAHFIAGYAIAGLILFRLAWGFAGSPRSRFADFLYGWPVVKRYTGRLFRLDPPHSIGHNPLGGWMIVVLIVTVTGMIVTGLFAAGRSAAGPLAGMIPLAIATLARSLHKLLSNFLIALIMAHLAGVAADWYLTGDNLVKAMLTGRKRLAPDDAVQEQPTASIWRAVLLGLLALAVTAGLTLSTDYTRNRSTLSQITTQQ
jgi:cytochrome b